jgi:hypothetical protein
MTTTHENILRAYRSATDDQVRRGIEWYPDVHALATRLDRGNVRRAAGIIAALSPQVEWSRNLLLASRVYQDGFASGCLRNNCLNADRIYGGEDFRVVLKGPKTFAFARCIADPWITDDVVIDRHAVSVAIGRNATTADQKAAVGTPGRYHALADDYRAVADTIGLGPCTVQAITWLWWRETHAAHRKAARRATLKEIVPA